MRMTGWSNASRERVSRWATGGQTQRFSDVYAVDQPVREGIIELQSEMRPVLLAQNVRAFVDQELVGEKLVKADHIVSNYTHLKKRLFFFSSRRRHTRCLSDWSSDVCSSD